MGMSIDVRQMKALEADLAAFRRNALPFATRNTLNSGAFLAQRMSKARLGNQFILKNKFTERSIRVNKAKTLDIKRQSATVGSTEEYMEDQELGGVKVKRGKEGVPIPTSASAGQQGSQRTRLPRRANQIRNIRLRRGMNRPPGQPKTSKQRLLFRVQDAVTTGKRFIFHDFGGRKKAGIFKVVGGRKGSKRGWPKGAKLRMIYSLDKDSVRIPKRPWLAPTIDEVIKVMPGIHIKSLKFQLKKHGLLR